LLHANTKDAKIAQVWPLNCACNVSSSKRKRQYICLVQPINHVADKKQTRYTQVKTETLQHVLGVCFEEMCINVPVPAGATLQGHFNLTANKTKLETTEKTT
jgi:hypothetical protein